MLTKRLLLVITAIAMMSFVVAQPTYKQNTDIALNIPCTINGAICSPSALCNGSIITPSGILLINNQVMYQNNAMFIMNLTSNQTSELNEYEFPVTCCDGSACATRTLNFFITPTGEIPSTAGGLMYIGVLVLLIIFAIMAILGGFKFDNIAMKAGAYLGAYLLMIGISFVAWNLALSYLTNSPFLISIFRIIFWMLLIAFLPILLVTVIYTFYMMVKIKQIQKLLDDGMPYDEAYARTLKFNTRGFSY